MYTDRTNLPHAAILPSRKKIIEDKKGSSTFGGRLLGNDVVLWGDEMSVSGNFLSFGQIRLLSDTGWY